MAPLRRPGSPEPTYAEMPHLELRVAVIWSFDSLTIVLSEAFAAWFPHWTPIDCPPRVASTQKPNASLCAAFDESGKRVTVALREQHTGPPRTV